jgi:hypothetical protein
MQSIDVDFNDLARDGKIRGWIRDQPVALNERVQLVEESEHMTRDAILTDVDGDWGYFDLVPAHLLPVPLAFDAPSFIAPLPWYASGVFHLVEPLPLTASIQIIRPPVSANEGIKSKALQTQ